MHLPPEKLGDLINTYKADGEQLKDQISEIVYFLKGGVEFNTAWGLSFEDRERLVRVINKRLKEQNPGGKEYM